MKTFSLAFFLLSIHFCFSQKLSSENICSLKIDSIYNFLISPNDLTSSEIKELATTLAKKDKQTGNNRILKNMGYSEYGCDICVYSKYGFVPNGHSHPFPIGNTPQTDIYLWKFMDGP